MATEDFFRARLNSMIDMRHPLAVLATSMPWADVEASLAPVLSHKDRSGRVVQDADLFGPTAQLAGARPPSSTLTARKSLIYLGQGSKAQTTERAGRVLQALVWAVGVR